MPVVACFTLSQPQDVNAFSSDSIATGSIPTALSTPGTAGLLNLQPASQQFADLYNQNPTLTNNMISNPQSTSTTNNTNTFLSGASQFLSSYPSYLASTAANLAKYLGSIPGYTPGGAPLANFGRRLLDWFYNFLLVDKPFEYPPSERV